MNSSIKQHTFSSEEFKKKKDSILNRKKKLIGVSYYVRLECISVL